MEHAGLWNLESSEDCLVIKKLASRLGLQEEARGQLNPV